ncbi:MAG: hypothetical protein JXB15_04485 [Anaerolineales bacterium]|nr:hypothetical protein [Anaerolineales bacterium]
MRKPEKITITTFWLDWLLLPITLGAGWLTYHWAIADFRLALQASVEPGGRAALPPWTVAIPLVVCAVGWVIVGLGSLIREEYYEHRIWVAVLAAWSLSCLLGAVLIGLSFLPEDSNLGLAGVLNLTGLVLTAIMFSLPAFMKVPLGAKAIRFSHQWTVLLAVCTGCLMAGMLLGFPYKFPRFSLGIGAFSFFGLGALETAFSTPAFPWLPRLYDFEMGQDTFFAGLPKSTLWRIEGLIKLVIGIGVAITLIIVSL